MLFDMVTSFKTVYNSISKELSKDLNIVVVISTLNTINSSCFKRFADDINKLSNLGNKITVINYGSKIQNKIDIEKSNQFKIKNIEVNKKEISFEPVIDKIEKLGVTPDLSIFFTDSFGVFPREPFPYPISLKVFPHGASRSSLWYITDGNEMKIMPSWVEMFLYRFSKGAI